jgi:hypothetical protein
MAHSDAGIIDALRVGNNKCKTVGTKSHWRGFQGGQDRLEREQIVNDNNLGASARYGGLARAGTGIWTRKAIYIHNELLTSGSTNSFRR